MSYSPTLSTMPELTPLLLIQIGVCLAWAVLMYGILWLSMRKSEIVAGAQHASPLVFWGLLAVAFVLGGLMWMVSLAWGLVFGIGAALAFLAYGFS